jgi:putative acetyltransferase
LIRAGLDRAQGGGWQAMFVLEEPTYYTRFGFDPVLAGGFTSPYAGPYQMTLALNGDLPVTSGTTEYAATFSVFEQMCVQRAFAIQLV